jgi:competence protein ComEC
MTPNRILTVGAAIFGVVALCAAGLLLGVWVRRKQVPVQAPPAVTIRFLELSDGDCAVVETPDDRFILIDAGGSGSGGDVAAALRQMGAQKIDLLVLASAEDTGIGGVSALVRSGLPILSVWNNNDVDDGGSERSQVIADLANARIPMRTVRAGVSQHIGTSPLVITVLWPPEHGLRAHSDSLVCRVDYGTESCLFLGPLSEVGEPYLISGAGPRLHADVMQVTDHGDGGGTSLELLRRATPEIAVISCEADRPPAPATLQRLQAAAAETWRTDQQGTVTVTLDMTANSPSVTGSRL